MKDRPQAMLFSSPSASPTDKGKRRGLTLTLDQAPSGNPEPFWFLFFFNPLKIQWEDGPRSPVLWRPYEDGGALLIIIIINNNNNK